jgi:hypothetical protein
MERSDEKLEHGVNYYVIAGIFISVLFFILANALEPQIDEQLDLFELIFILAYAAPAVFSFAIAKRYWPSKVFGKAYLALGIAYSLTAIGASLFDYYQMSGIPNPYPYYPDLFFAAFYPFTIYHLRTNINFIRGAQKPSLKRNHIMLLVVIPIGVTAFYAYGAWNYDPSLGLFDLDKARSTEAYVEGGPIDLIPRLFTLMASGPIEHDEDFIKGYLVGIYFTAATSFTFGWAIIGAQVFRGSVLGLPWGMILVGIGLNTVADVSYYYTSIEGYDRSNAIIGLWVLGCMIVSYALYMHKKQI